ncbi:MAG: hypothetical protein NTW10_06705 [Bacteroidetes bacterium]|nr:hypothetical protein [Bacteroidota bacterium]
MEEQPLLPATGTDGKRPTLLTVLCIFTFIGSGLNAFLSLMIFIFFDNFMKLVPEALKLFRMQEMNSFFESVRPTYFAAIAVISALAVAGAVRMWQLRKQGFHIYTVSQILLILAPMYFFRLPGPDFFSILLSGAFVMLYSSTLKKMS